MIEVFINYLKNFLILIFLKYPWLDNIKIDFILLFLDCDID